MSLGFLNWEGFLECPTCDYKWFTSYPVEWSKRLYPVEMQTTHWDKHSFTIEKYEPVSENAFALDDNTRFQHYLEYIANLETVNYDDSTTTGPILDNRYYHPSSFRLWWGKEQCWKCKNWYHHTELLHQRDWNDEDSTGFCPNPECGVAQEVAEEKIYEERANQSYGMFHEEELVLLGELIQYPDLFDSEGRVKPEWYQRTGYSSWIQGVINKYQKEWFKGFEDIHRTNSSVLASPVIVIPAAPQLLRYFDYKSSSVTDYAKLYSDALEMNLSEFFRSKLKYFSRSRPESEITRQVTNLIHDFILGCEEWEHRNQAWKQMCGEDYLENFQLLRGVPTPTTSFSEGIPDNQWIMELQEAWDEEGHKGTYLNNSHIWNQAIKGSQDYWVCVNTALNRAVQSHLTTPLDRFGRNPFTLTELAKITEKEVSSTPMELGMFWIGEGM